MSERKFNKYSKQNKGPVKVKIKFVNGRLSLEFPFNKELVDTVKTINGRTYDPTSKAWSIPFDQRHSMEQTLKRGNFDYSYESLALKMVNGGYEQFMIKEQDNKAKTIRLSFWVEEWFIVEYIGGYPPNSTQEMLAQDYYMKVRSPDNSTIVGKWIDQKNTWGWPISYYFQVVEVLKKLPKDKFKLEELSEGFRRCHQKSQSRQMFSDKMGDSVNINVNESMLNKLYPFQRVGIEEGIRRNGRVLIADEMGLGKTIQALGIAGHFREDWPLLIVSPSSVKFNWLVELSNWLSDEVDDSKVLVLYTGKSSKDIKKSTQVVIASYELCDTMIKSEKHLRGDGTPRFKSIILDESHYIKSNSKRADNCKKLCGMAKRVILLTGTPALAKPIELYNQIFAIDNNLFPSRHRYGVRYCEAVKHRFGWVYNGNANMEELKYILKNTIMIRRLKSEVLKDLPPKMRKIIHIELPSPPQKTSLNQERMMELFNKMDKMPGTVLV
jgi:hypothetical protein